MQTNPVFKIFISGILILVLIFACAIPFYFESPSLFYKFGTAKVLLRAGKIFGIMAGVLLIVQLVLISRFFFLDRVFGQDRLCWFHKINAIALTFAAMLHPFFVLWADDFAFYTLEIRYWPDFMGMGLLFVLCLMTLVSVFRDRIRIDWNRWSLAHSIVAPLIFVLFFIHVLNVSKPFGSGLPNQLLLLSLFFTACLFIRKWFVNIYSVKKKYRVVAIKPAARNIWAIDVQPCNGAVFNYIPGQFAYITPFGDKISGEEHPFSIASSPLDTERLQFIVRSCGDFTERIKYLKNEDTIRIDGPYGRFSHFLLKEKSSVIMIAGGIGVTPMLSMLRSMARSRYTGKVMLIWSNKTRDDIVFADEFSDLAQKIKCLDILHVITRESSVQDSFRRITKDSLRTMLKTFDRDAPVFLCGPPAMMDAVKKILKILGFSASGVYTESFLL